MYDTMELGPILHTTAPTFSLGDHSGKTYTLDNLMGANGLLLGFVGDIWQPTSIRRILWLQRHVSKFALMGTPVALLVRDHANTLYGFQVSSPLPVPFPLLADEDGRVHLDYHMDRYPGLLLLDYKKSINAKWLMPDDRVWPRMNELVKSIQHLQAYA